MPGHKVRRAQASQELQALQGLAVQTDQRGHPGRWGYRVRKDSRASQARKDHRARADKKAIEARGASPA